MTLALTARRSNQSARSRHPLSIYVLSEENFKVFHKQAHESSIQKFVSNPRTFLSGEL